MGVGGQQMNRSAGQCLQCFDESRGGGNKLHGMSAGEKVRGGLVIVTRMSHVKRSMLRWFDHLTFGSCPHVPSSS